MDEITAAKIQVGTQAAARPGVELKLAPSEVAPSPPRDKPAQAETDVDKAVEQLKRYAALHNINLHFSVHKATGRTVIKVIDANTEKVVREIPPEEILNLLVSIEQMTGHLLNATA